MKERILGLVQYWADAFKGKPQLVAVVELYEQLKGEGVEFPPVDLDAMAPVDTPERVRRNAGRHSLDVTVAVQSCRHVHLQMEAICLLLNYTV